MNKYNEISLLGGRCFTSYRIAAQQLEPYIVTKERYEQSLPVLYNQLVALLINHVSRTYC